MTARLRENTANQRVRTPPWPPPCQHSVFLGTREINQMGGLFVLQQQCKTRAWPCQLNFRLPVTIDRQHGHCGNAAPHLFGRQTHWKQLRTAFLPLTSPPVRGTPASGLVRNHKTCPRSEDDPMCVHLLPQNLWNDSMPFHEREFQSATDSLANLTLEADGCTFTNPKHIGQLPLQAK